MSTNNRPFSCNYVLQLTLRNMQSAINTSISKTTARIAEFENNPEKSKEVLVALSHLHKMKQGLDEFSASLVSK